MEHTVENARGAIAGGGAPAVAAGARVLEEGGNAADAAVASILALQVTDHGQCSIGGEVPLLIYDSATREVSVFCGQGRAPLSQEAIDWYMKNGIPDGDIKMAPVPSVVDLCATVLAERGTCSFEHVAEPTIKLLDAGDEIWHPRLAATLRKLIDSERATSGTREEGVRAAADRFYGRNGQPADVADALESYYQQNGGFLRKADLAAHTTTVEPPVSIDFHGYTICKCGPWTQGPFLCQTLRLLDTDDLGSMGRLTPDLIHRAIEAVKLAMADRDAYYGDPDFVDVPLTELLSEQYARIRRPLIDMNRASAEVRPGDPRRMRPLAGPGAFLPSVGGTTTCVVGDRWGNVVAATPSANVPASPRDGGPAGVTYGNRLRSFNTTPGHPNCIAPGKRPRITLTPTIVLKGDKPAAAVSVAGGDLQDQVTLCLLLDHITFGTNTADAVTSPRFATAHHEDSFDPNPNRAAAFKDPVSLIVSEHMDRSVARELERRGHTVELRQKAVGHPVMLTVDPATGAYDAAGDPKAGRHAAGV